MKYNIGITLQICMYYNGKKCNKEAMCVCCMFCFCDLCEVVAVTLQLP